ncbi:hypothetical protein R5W23_000473 [Gemmata sp. JC673]|uniref:Uncharacterized protein n=1 Tax=Gemmata algarum TaxID=2975278 RepID=A0ABU5EW91_9BACT|nr:hypothetical protein [Gemmata algarum]MDY3559480.1 hypothetical protein [Gemmata algarum]
MSTDRLTGYQGEEGVTPEDWVDPGSTFAAVRDAVFEDTRYYDVWNGPGTAKLPVYPLGLWDLLRRALWAGHYPFRRAADRTVDTHADLRWGPDRRGVRRLLHPNGVCLTGVWEITEPTEYTGYFRQNSRGLVIGRYSAGGAVLRGQPRSLSLVGKLYPTADRRDPRRYVPAGIITQEDFGGPGAPFINDAELRNAPSTHAWRRGLVALAMLAVTGAVFRRADTNPTFRQLYEISELGEPPGAAAKAPEFMRLLVAPEQPRVGGPGDRIDVRDEVLAQIYEPGVREPKKTLVFNIEVSDTGSTRGPAVRQIRTVTNWKRIGRITFDEAVASYNGDFVIHFHHPAWRLDHNNPATAVRAAARAGRPVL